MDALTPCDEHNHASDYTHIDFVRASFLDALAQRTNISHAEHGIILSALRIAAEAHKPATRKSIDLVHRDILEEEIPQPYLIHPLRIALSALRKGFSADIVVLGLLHDVPEDTKHIYCLPEAEQREALQDYLKKGLHPVIEDAIMLSRRRSSNDLPEIDYYENVTSRYRRTVVKLLDGTDNHRDVLLNPGKKAIEKAREVLDIYAPALRTMLDIGIPERVPEAEREACEDLLRESIHYAQRILAHPAALLAAKQRVVSRQDARHLALQLALFRQQQQLTQHYGKLMRKLLPELPAFPEVDMQLIERSANKEHLKKLLHEYKTKIAALRSEHRQRVGVLYGESAALEKNARKKQHRTSGTSGKKHGKESHTDKKRGSQQGND